MPFEPNPDTRTLVITPPWGSKDKNALTAFKGMDKISFPYSYHLEVLSDELDLDPLTIVGKECKFSVKRADDKLAEFTGKVWKFSAEGTYEYEDSRVRFYTLELAPHFKFLSLNKDSRVFQEKTVPQIVETVLKDHGVKYKTSLKGAYAKLDYCAQWRESDYEFATRLMEDVGIFYFFNGQSNHQMVLADAASGYLDLGDQGIGLAGEDADGGIESWSHFYRMAPAEVVISEYEFQTPATLIAKEKTILKLKDKFEVFDYPGGQDRTSGSLIAADLKSIAVSRMEAYESNHNVVRGKGRWESFLPGYKFKLEKHWAQGEGQKYAITYVKHQVRDPYLHEVSRQEDRYLNEFECVPDKTPYRPLRTSQHPVIVGPQPATVVGPKNSEVYTDKYGRVKISFPWDRESKMDDKSSCWVRVSQEWAGKNWGSFFLPRVGQEVLVEFINGDPSRPIVTGRVYNADQMPPVKLPDEEFTSTIKTYSDKSRFNELRFVDKKDKEQIYFRAQKDYVRVVEKGGGDVLKVGYKDATGTPTENSQTIDILQDRTVTLEKGADLLNIKTGDRTINIDKGSQAITVKQGDHTLMVKQGKVVIEAAKQISLKVGANSIVIDTQGIKIQGAKVLAQGKMKVDVKAPMTTVSGDGMLTLKGGLVKIN